MWILIVLKKLTKEPTVAFDGNVTKDEQRSLEILLTSKNILKLCSTFLMQPVFKCNTECLKFDHTVILLSMNKLHTTGSIFHQ